MKADMTYNEVDLCREEVKKMMEYIKALHSKALVLQDNDISFFSALCKRILFFKYLHNSNYSSDKYFRILISDLYYMIQAIINCDIRYLYLNERSMIENYTRLIVKVDLENDYVTRNTFNILEAEMKTLFNDDCQYSLIKNEYTIACNYVHGGDLLKDDLVEYFKECYEKKGGLKDRNKYYNRVLDVIKIFERVLIYKCHDYIDGVFSRKKSVLEYLIGKEATDTLVEYMTRIKL